MKLSKHRRRPDVAFNMTPMIDIVFLLIIFFMTVSQITQVNDEPIELPKLEGSLGFERFARFSLGELRAASSSLPVRFVKAVFCCRECVARGPEHRIALVGSLRGGIPGFVECVERERGGRV